MARLVVRLTPRAGRDGIDGWTTDAEGRPLLLARTAAKPADGRANDALERLIAKALGLPPSAVKVASGAKSRVKTLHLDGIDETEARRRLTPP
jgi:uncharacterized protein YggU (UPF0235/DUF167 family)